MTSWPLYDSFTIHALLLTPLLLVALLVSVMALKGAILGYPGLYLSSFIYKMKRDFAFKPS